MTTASLLCVHVWDIDQANGPTSKGTCKRCGEAREFLNAIPEDDLEYGRTKPYPEVKKEAPMGKGGNNRARSLALKPAKIKAESLFREGKTSLQVGRLLRPEFGSIPTSTLAGWKTRLKPITHKEVIPESAQSHTETIPLWDTVLASKPDWRDKPKCAAWKRLLDAAFEWMVG